jgi:hypothetical protein
MVVTLTYELDSGPAYEVPLGSNSYLRTSMRRSKAGG